MNRTNEQNLRDSDQCREKEENSRMVKTRDIFKKIRDTEGTFHERRA